MSLSKTARTPNHAHARVLVLRLTLSRLALSLLSPWVGAVRRPVALRPLQSVEFLINGDPSLARNTAAEILAQRGFTLSWASDWNATAVRGSTAGNVLLGAFAQKFEVGLSVSSVGNGQSVIRFDRKNRGWMGGAIGAVRVARNMTELRDQFRDAMTTRGMLAGVQET